MHSERELSESKGLLRLSTGEIERTFEPGMQFGVRRLILSHNGSEMRVFEDPVSRTAIPSHELMETGTIS